MANVNYIYGYNKIASANNKLLAVYGNDVVNIDTGLGYGLNLISPELATMEPFLNHTFLQRYTDVPLTFNGTSWGITHVGRTPVGKCQKTVNTKVYIGNTALIGPDQPTEVGPWPSRVFKSDLATNQDDLSWGIEWGTNLSTTANSPLVTLSNSVQDFKYHNIKIGDPFYITQGLGANFQSFVKSVDSRYQITLTDVVQATTTGSHFWVGSNWFDVATDDNDEIVTLEDYLNKVLVFKTFSLWVYNEVALQHVNRYTDIVLLKVKDAPGTTSKNSVINIGDFTFYFFGSNTNNRRTGIYMFNGSKSINISHPIQWYINAMSSSNYINVVAWREGNKLRMYLGALSDPDRSISISNAVATYDTDGGQWSVDPISDVITASGRYVESNTEKWFIGTSSSKIMESPSGNSFNGKAIPFSVETGFRYPDGSSTINKFTRIQVVSRGGRGIQVSYKLAGTPNKTDDQWNGLNDLENDFQEIFIPTAHQRGRGINLKFMDLDGNLNNFTIQKITVFRQSVELRSKT